MYKTNKLSEIFYVIAVIIIIAITITSCTSAKKLSYFQDLPNTTTVNLPPMPQEERIIENGDELYISFSARDNQAASYFNKTSVTPSVSTKGAASAEVAGGSNYLVSPQGSLEFPIIGKIKVTGLTASQVQQNLIKTVNPYLKDPIVEVRFNTLRISVLGEVRSPGIHTLPMQKPTLFEALASAGDLPLTAQRYDIQLYRDYNGQRKIIKLDLTQAEILTNPEVFQIKHNDVLYVKPRSSTVFRQETGFVTGMISLVLGLVTLAFTISNNR